MKARDAAEWGRVLRACGVMEQTAAAWAPAFAGEMREGAFSAGDRDLADFLPEILHESAMLETTVENLNYAADALVPLFGIARITPTQARMYGRIDGRQKADQQGIANTVYGGAWGLRHLGNSAAGDGWRFRGRSPLQITGRANYAAVGLLMGQDLTVSPQLLEQPRYGIEACVHWWEDRIPDSMLGETTSLRARVNGGTLGLAEVVRLTDLARRALS